MNKYLIYRHDGDIYDVKCSRELVGVEYGASINDTSANIVDAITQDLSENPAYSGCEVEAYEPEVLNWSDLYSYHSTGVVYIPKAPTNVLVQYGIAEVVADERK